MSTDRDPRLLALVLAAAAALGVVGCGKASPFIRASRADVWAAAAHVDSLVTALNEQNQTLMRVGLEEARRMPHPCPFCGYLEGYERKQP